MKTAPTLRHDEPNAAYNPQYSTALAAFADLEWQRAQQRVLLYLQRLNVPAHKAVELCLEALRRASSADTPRGHGHPIAVTMQALNELLAEHKLGVSGIWKGLPTGDGKSIKYMPTLNRGSMAPQAIDLRPWLTPLVKLLRRLKALMSGNRAVKLACLVQLFLLQR
jgi:hypothetical protein